MKLGYSLLLFFVFFILFVSSFERALSDSTGRSGRKCFRTHRIAYPTTKHTPTRPHTHTRYHTAVSFNSAGPGLIAITAAAARRESASLTAITDNMVQLQRKEKGEEKGTSRTGKVDGRRGKDREEVKRLRGMLHAGDAGIVSRSSEGLERMMTVIVTACSSFGLTVSEAKKERASQRRGEGVVHKQCSRPGIQKIEFVYLGGAITADTNLSIEITRRLQRAWACFQRYKMEIYDRLGARLRLKVRLLKAEVVETLLYGCMTWSRNKPDYDRLRRVHHSMLLR